MSDLPPLFTDWFITRGWTIHPHQQLMLEQAAEHALMLIAPTGGGKTLGATRPVQRPATLMA